MEKKISQKTEKKADGCQLSQKCGGCTYQGMTYEKQCKLKQRRTEELLGGFCKVQPIIRMENPYHYRNKVHAVFDRDRKGKPVSGIYQEGTHRVVPVDTCMIEDEKSDAIIVTIRNLLPSFKIKVYDEDTGYGLLRHVLVRRSFSNGQIMVVLVTASPVFPSKNNFVKALLKEHPEITTVIQNVNGRNTSMVLGQKENVLYGKGYIEDTLCGCVFRISSKSFYQINPVQTEKLYAKAIELADLKGTENVLDAYCGIGTIGLIAAAHCRQVAGVELNPDAVKDAVNNRNRNKVENARFFRGDAGEFMVGLANDGQKLDVVFMDPPRSGSTEEFIDAVEQTGAKRVVYISCNPETLARDLQYFEKKGYQAGEAWPVDMFPWTDSIEAVTVLNRKK
ncbi:MAG: 23S rRNA (uracil(1939)-C(5))-methyltransferase RlmD [Lachnospiraceae bacterium]|nr:23S rRNA (uracil(1939)-C(5))-methyltransferase RlmD [Lachnospiraceae bacterium]